MFISPHHVGVVGAQVVVAQGEARPGHQSALRDHRAVSCLGSLALQPGAGLGLLAGEVVPDREVRDVGEGAQHGLLQIGAIQRVVEQWRPRAAAKNILTRGNKIKCSLPGAVDVVEDGDAEVCARAPALGCPAPGPASSSLLWPSTESLRPLQKFNEIFSKRKNYFFYLLPARTG